MCTHLTHHETFETERAEAFGNRMIDVLNHSATALMISVGHRTGLFDTLAQLESTTSEALARRSGLDERYVREWLAAVTVSGIVLHDPVADSYSLPAEHAAFLTRAASPDNMGVFMQYVSVLGQVEDDIVDCFHNGGGVPYSKFRRFHEVMAEESGLAVDAALVEDVLPLVPGLTERLESGIEVLDVGCGSGRAMTRLAELFPHSRFAGYDFSEEAIGRAQSLTERKALTNLYFEVRDAAHLGESGRYDLVTTFDAIHDQAAPATVLSGINQALRPDGVYLMQDIAGSSHLHKNLDHPIAPFLYTISCMHCMTVSLASGGEGLGTMWGEELALSMLDEAGFDPVTVHQVEGDIQNNYYVAHPA